jgi:hypothetical protein
LIVCSAGLEQARKLAEELGREIELYRMGLDPFPFDRLFAGPHESAGDVGNAISSVEAIRRTEQWWSHLRRRGVSAPVSWAIDPIPSQARQPHSLEHSIPQMPTVRGESTAIWR